jgi:hypothetical protein
VTERIEVSRHPAELLSALLDGELPSGDADIVRAHVLTCATCAAELDAVRHARAALRSLPAVEPPPAFLDSLLETAPAPSNVVPLRARRAALANAAAAVAAGLLIVAGLGDRQASAVAPQLAGSVEQHAATISAVSTGLGGPSPILAPGEVTPTTAPERSTDVPHPYVAPAKLAGYELVGAYEAPSGVHLLYEKGLYALSVFEAAGDLDAGDLPVHMTHLAKAGDVENVWRWDGGTAAGRVVLFERGGVVFTIVGDESRSAVLAAAHALPRGRHASLPTRIRRGCSELLDGLSPAG